MEQTVIFNQNLLKKGEYYHLTSTIFEEGMIVVCTTISDTELTIEDNEKHVSHMYIEDVLHLGMIFENVTIHPHDDEEILIQ